MPLINVEPGLFEWAGWFKLQPHLPRFLSPLDLCNKCGYNNVALDYTAHMNVGQLNVNETLHEYYTRSHATIQHVANNTTATTTTLVIAHAASLDTCTRMLIANNNNTSNRTEHEFMQLLNATGNLACVAVQQQQQQQQQTDNKWTLVQPPILPLAHSNNSNYNWHALVELVSCLYIIY